VPQIAGSLGQTVILGYWERLCPDLADFFKDRMLPVGFIAEPILQPFGDVSQQMG
jgi:hypothetical protein